MPMLFTGCALLGVLALLLLLGGPEVSPYPARRPGQAVTRRMLPGLRLNGVSCFAAFFGLGGLLASWLGLTPVPQVIFALLAALTVGGLTAWALQLAGQRRVIGAVTDGSLIGQTARVLMSPRGDVPGQVSLEDVSLETGPDQRRPARSADLLTPGDRVLVVADLGGLLDVLRWEGH